MPPVSPGLLGGVLAEDTGASAFAWVANACDRHLPGSGPLFLIAVTAGAAFVGWSAWGHRLAGPARGVLVIAAVYWGAMIAYSLAVVPIIWPRTMLPGMLPCLLSLGLGIWSQPVSRRRRAATGVAVLLALAMMVPWLRGLAWQPTEDLRGLADAVRSRSRPADLLLLVNDVECAFEPYWPEYRENPVLKVRLGDPSTSALRALTAARARFPEHPVVLIYREDLVLAPHRAALEAIAKVLAVGSAPPEMLWNRSGYHVLRFLPLPPP